MAAPIDELTVFNYLPDSTGVAKETDTVFNVTSSPVIHTGLPKDVYDYDYGSVGGGVGTSLLRHTQIVYNTTLTNGIINRPATVKVYDGSSTLVSSTAYQYDTTSLSSTSGTPQHNSITGSRGNMTLLDLQANAWHPSLSAIRLLRYRDVSITPMISALRVGHPVRRRHTLTAPGLAGIRFQPTLAPLSSLAHCHMTLAVWESGIQVTDSNGHASNINYTTDSAFWRPNSAQDAASNLTTYTYTGQNKVESVMSFNGGASVTDQVTFLDNQGRTIFQQTKQGPSATNYDTVATCYDSNGRTSFVSIPYSTTIASSGSPCPTTAKGTSTTYDALNRIASSSDSGGGGITYTYSHNDTYQSLTPAPTGELAKRKQFEYDGLNRLTSVCEVTSGSGSYSGGTCAQNTTPQPTGYWTTYTYDAFG